MMFSNVMVDDCKYKQISLYKCLHVFLPNDSFKFIISVKHSSVILDFVSFS